MHLRNMSILTNDFIYFKMGLKIKEQTVGPNVGEYKVHVHNFVARDCVANMVGKIQVEVVMVRLECQAEDTCAQPIQIM